MPKVSVNILTRNRSELLKKALASVTAQAFTDYEVVVVNDGSSDETSEVLENTKIKNFKIIEHSESFGIVQSRQEALNQSGGEYVAILDDDDQWLDPDKLKKQVEFLDNHRDYVLAGGAITSAGNKFRPETDAQIRKTMLFRNNFFTSTIMFRKEAALKAGGFVKDDVDLAEDYDLWLRMGLLGKMYNFQQVFTTYAAPSYNTSKFRSFLSKQLTLIARYRKQYPGYLLASLILRIRLAL